MSTMRHGECRGFRFKTKSEGRSNGTYQRGITPVSNEILRRIVASARNKLITRTRPSNGELSPASSVIAGALL